MRYFGNLFRRPLRKFGMRVQPGAYGGAADGQIVDAIERLFGPGDIALHQAGPSANLLPKRERRGIHQMRAANLHHVRELLGLASSACCTRFTEGISALCMRSAAAMCMAAGKVSLED